MRSIVEMNTALQEKWLWRFTREEWRLWRRVMEAQWGKMDGQGELRNVYRLHGMSLWKTISMGSQQFLIVHNERWERVIELVLVE